MTIILLGASITFSKTRSYINLFWDIWKFVFIYLRIIEKVTNVARKKHLHFD